MSDYQELLAELPSDWSTLPIEEIGEVISGGTPSRSNPRYWGGEIPWVTPGEVTSVGKKHLEETDEKITAEGLAKSGAMLLPSNSLLITTRASLGAAVLNMAPATTNQGFKSIAFIRHFSPDYYFHWSTKLKAELVRLASGTTFLEISGTEFRKISLPVPPYAEQVLIARILDTLDTQIEKTEALIAKLEKVKEGLLHDLLTLGIDENGQLRPSPEQAPELYKESPLGLIPKDWHTTSLGSILDRIEAGKSPSCPDIPAPSGEWGVLKVSAVNPKGFRSSENKVVERRSLIVEHYEVKRGDLLITRANTPDLVGASCIVNDWTSRLMLSDKTLRLLEKPDLAMKEYIYHSLQQSYMRQQISIAATGTSMSMKNISQGAILTLSILVPPIDEQSDICKRVDVLAKRITHEKSKASKLYQDKSGLMNDLLTGRVRVTPLLEKDQATTPA